MKQIYREIGVCAIALVAASGGAAMAQDITAEEAQYQALYICMISGDWPARTEDGFPGRVSTVRTYDNYDRSRSYYLCYVYDGAGDMPTWEELETAARDGSAFPPGVYGFIIPASADEMGYPVPARRLVAPELQRPMYEGIAAVHFGAEPAVFVRTVIENGPGEFALFGECRAGDANILVNESGLVVPPPGSEETARENGPPPAETVLKNRRGAVLGSIFKSSWVK